MSKELYDSLTPGNKYMVDGAPRSYTLYVIKYAERET